jgi:hypothetical protein
MSRVSYFQRFSQRENHATNNTMLVLRHFYATSPAKLQRVLTGLLEDELNIGLGFQQQVRGPASIPDALITQQQLNIYIETKLGGQIDVSQIQRHLETIRSRTDGIHKGDVLLALTKEPLRDSGENLRVEAAEQGVKFTAVTFSQVVEALRTQVAPHETDLADIVDDYEAFLDDENLLQEQDMRMPVFACGKSLRDNEKFGVYYEPPTRPSKHSYRYIGCYSHMAVRLVGELEFVAVTRMAEGQLEVDTVELGEDSPPNRQRIRDVIDATPYYDLSVATRFYLVKKFFPTEARKVSRGGIISMQYLDLRSLITGYVPSQGFSAENVAEAIRGVKWE